MGGTKDMTSQLEEARARRQSADAVPEPVAHLAQDLLVTA